MIMFRDITETISKLPKLAIYLVFFFFIIGLTGPWLTPHDPLIVNLLEAGVGPSAEHWMGTDHLGRDTFSRLIASARTSLVGMSLILAFALTIGISIGTLAGYQRGKVEEVLMRLVDVGQSIPSLIVALAVIGIFGTGYWNMVLALAIAWWPGFARVSRVVAVNVMNKPHIESFRVLGASPARIIFLQLLPTTIGAVLVYATADAGALALSIATLSFLGLGIQPPTPEWGQMLVDGLPFLESDPRQVILPGLALTLVVIGFNFLGESIALNRVPKPLSRLILKRRRFETNEWIKE